MEGGDSNRSNLLQSPNISKPWDSWVEKIVMSISNSQWTSEGRTRRTNGVIMADQIPELAMKVYSSGIARENHELSSNYGLIWIVALCGSTELFIVRVHLGEHGEFEWRGMCFFWPASTVQCRNWGELRSWQSCHTLSTSRRSLPLLRDTDPELQGTGCESGSLSALSPDSSMV
jgi:hypothetical protein